MPDRLTSGGLFATAVETRDALTQAILDTTVDGIIVIDEQGHICLFNPAAEKVFGYKAKEVLGQPVSLLMPQPESRKHQEYVQKYLDHGQAHVIGVGREVTGLRRNGRRFPVDLSVSELKVGDRRLFTGLVRDITKRKRVERALQEERSFANAILNTVGALVTVLDDHGHIVRFNRTCEHLTGLDAGEVLGQPFWDILACSEDSTLSRRKVEEMLYEGRTGDYENRITNKKGQRRRIAWSNTILNNEDGSIGYLIATGLDITERKQAEAALVSASETERQLVGQELHDALGQTMTGMALLSSALERRLKLENHSEQHQVAEITKLAQVALGEVRRLSQGLYPVGLERHGLSAALQELVDSQRKLLHDIHCTFDGVDKDAEALDRPTQLHLYRIAQEALNNAVKHSGAGDIMITFFNDANLLKLTIEDDGCGLPEEQDLQGLGLTIMRYRALQIDATFHIGPRKRGGTRVECILQR